MLAVGRCLSSGISISYYRVLSLAITFVRNIILASYDILQEKYNTKFRSLSKRMARNDIKVLRLRSYRWPFSMFNIDRSSMFLIFRKFLVFAENTKKSQNLVEIRLRL